MLIAGCALQLRTSSPYDDAYSEPVTYQTVWCKKESSMCIYNHMS